MKAIKPSQLFQVTFLGMIQIVALFFTGCEKPDIPDNFSHGLECVQREWFRDGQRAVSQVDALGRLIASEPNGEIRQHLYAALTNTIANLPLTSTNAVKRLPQIPNGMDQSPRVPMIRAYSHFTAQARRAITGDRLFDDFCFDLEIWKRLKSELEETDAFIEQWVRLRYEAFSKNDLEFYKKDTRVLIKGAMKDIERRLEGVFSRETEESRRAFHVFQQVVGRKATPRYR